MRSLTPALLLSFVLSLTACETLMTRGQVREVEQKKQFQEQVTTLQKTTADTNVRFADIEEDLRTLNGRVEVVENKINLSSQERDRMKSISEQSATENSKKIQILQDEMIRLQEQVGALTAELQNLRASGGQESRPSSEKKDLFQIGEDLFDKKEWRKAILNYQKFRDANPRHKKFAEATYKIGVAFQELGMKDEARTFFDEVIGKFPNSSQAKKARTRLKSIKK